MSLTLPTALVSCALIAACMGRPAPATVPDGGYQVVHGWPVLPANMMLDEVSAVAVDSRDRVFVLTRGNRKWPDSGPLDTTPIHAPTVTVFDGPSGRKLSQWPGDRFALPHSITIDRNGDVWVTDVAWHQVLKFSPDGVPLLTLGQRGMPGTDSLHFDRPSDVAVAPDGSVYVSDGYGNNRIVRLAADGRWLGAWGRKGTGAGELDLPHALAVDSRGRVFVVDRGNARIQIFDSAGTYLAQWPATSFTGAQDVKIGGDGQVYIAGAGADGPEDRTGVVILDSTGAFAGKIGRFGNYDGQFEDLHWIALSPTGALYAADFSGRRVQKFVRTGMRR
jgi:peptidylamidoglycolate lyase